LPPGEAFVLEMIVRVVKPHAGYSLDGLRETRKTTERVKRPSTQDGFG